MKTYKSSDLTHKRAEVMREAELNGVIIQECRTNGDVVKEFTLTKIDRSLLECIRNDMMEATYESNNTDR